MIQNAILIPFNFKAMKMNKFSFTFFLITLLISSTLLAQRRGPANRGKITYTNLANRAAAPSLFFDQIILPGNSDDEVQLVFLFKMDNSYLPFKKIAIGDKTDHPEGANFYATARLNAEIFSGKASRKNRSASLASASRDTWQDTLYAQNYDETKSREKFAAGKLVTSLKPGDYNYVLQLNLMEETNDRNSQKRNISIKSFSDKKTGDIYLIEKGSSPENLKLVNLGNNILYGKNYQVLVRIPDYQSSKSYSIELNRASVNRKDTTNISSVQTISIESENIYQNASIELLDTNNPALKINQTNGKYTYALVSIPNSELENSLYNLELHEGGNKKPLAKKLVRSYWPDIPPALLNLDVSIDMMKYIVSEDALKEFKRGKAVEKEKKFRDFWKKRDPSPNTEFNELMTEYYHRVHHAFVEYRTPETPNGQDTDQGEIYIKYGPPSSRERTFPKKGLVIEKWEYPGRAFIFEKGAGFSEFVLSGK